MNSFDKCFSTTIELKHVKGDHHTFIWKIVNKDEEILTFTPNFKEHERKLLLNFINENYTTDSKFSELLDSVYKG